MLRQAVDVTVSANGSFTFPNITYGNGYSYNITVVTQPAGQTCSVANGAGTVSGADVTNVIVTCSAGSFTVGGTVSGLSGSVVLQNNNGNNLTVLASGPFVFPAPLGDAATYNVTVLTQPSGQTCSVTNGTGTIGGSSIANVVVTCAANANTFTVGGTVTGLSGTVVLRNNGGNNLTVSVNGPFTFSAALANSSTYSVTVLTQPAGQTCSVANGTGTLNGANVTNVSVTCVAVGGNTTHTVGGTVTGLSGTTVLRNNGGDDLTLSVDGSFAFSTALTTASTYNVTVLTQPASQTCTVTNGAGTVANANITNVSVTCGGSLAGGPLALFAGDMGGGGNVDGTAAARFSLPFGVATDSANNVYVADFSNKTIRKITPAGVVSTFAGTAGVTGSADATGAAARFSVPSDVATDSAGNVYVTDSNTIRKITPAGVVTTFAGTAGLFGSTDGTGAAARFGTQFNGVKGIATDGVGNVYVADTPNNTIRKITPAGVVSTFAGSAGVAGSTDATGAAARFNSPSGVATDSAGNVYVADSNNDTIRKITAAGAVTTLAGTAGLPGSADGTGAAARFNGPQDVATDSGNNVYVADFVNNAIRKITPAGVVTTLAGAGLLNSGSVDGTGAAARFNFPRGVATDSAGNVYVADTSNDTIRKITPAGVVTTLAGTPPVSGSTDGTGAAARFSGTWGVATDSAGNVYVADQLNHTIRKITPAGAVTTLAGTPSLSGGSADGTGAAASFKFPMGVATDSTGNVYVADTENHTIRKITSGGVVTTFAGKAGVGGSADGTGAAARFNRPQGLATDTSGNIYVADTSSDTIRKITPAGVVSTFAGTAFAIGIADGTGAAARFFQPGGVATDSAGNVYVADTVNSTIRKITPGGVVTTLAGLADGTSGSTDGTGTAARFSFPQNVTTDTAGNIYVADTGNSTIRKVTPSGVVSTIVGVAGQASFMPGALPGLLGFPVGVAISGTSLYITLYNGVAVVSNVP